MQMNERAGDIFIAASLQASPFFYNSVVVLLGLWLLGDFGGRLFSSTARPRSDASSFIVDLKPLNNDRKKQNDYCKFVDLIKLN